MPSPTDPISLAHAHFPLPHPAPILRAIASALDSSRDQILSTCSSETALTIEELAPEFARMTGALRLFADVAQDGSWVRPAIDPKSDKAVGPGHDVRSMLMPLGVVAVFGASNFPLAYGVCGGDTASALAAGCPVVVKEHPAHPKTGRLIAKLARNAIASTGASPDILGYVENEDPRDYSIAQQLVQHPLLAAVGFTGSHKAGMALDQLARERPIPIPVFAEMGSCNPVLITPAAARARAEQISQQLADSFLTRAGQQCTKPGLLFVPTDAPAQLPAQLIDSLSARVRAAPPRRLLAPWIRESYLRALGALTSTPGVRILAQSPASADHVGATLLETDAPTFASHPILREEIFGPCTILVRYPGTPDLSPLRGSLTFSIFCEPHEPIDLAPILPLTGRLIINNVPTGVRVAPAMVHGGPYPATNHPNTTAVGPLALDRWSRRICFQNCPDALLPPALRTHRV